MKNVLTLSITFAIGFISGTIYVNNKEDIQDIIANEKKQIEKFKKNPKNKGFLSLFNKGGKK